MYTSLNKLKMKPIAIQLELSKTNRNQIFLGGPTFRDFYWDRFPKAYFKYGVECDCVHI